MLIATPGELAVMHDVLLDREYEPSGRPRVILDLGANVGFATLFLHRRFPDARIVAVEADPATHARLERNVGALAGVTTLHRAISGSDAPVSFFSSGESIGSSIVRRSEAASPVEVPGQTIGSLMREVGADRVDLLKIDIEGAEFDALREAPLDRVDEVIAEVHYDLGGGDEQTVRDLLAGFTLDFRPLPQAGRFLVYGTR
jgi:FkbM family methyltransferase